MMLNVVILIAVFSLHPSALGTAESYVDCSEFYAEYENVLAIKLPSHCKTTTILRSHSIKCDNDIPDFATINRTIMDQIDRFTIENCKFATITRQRFQYFRNVKSSVRINCDEIAVQDGHALDDLTRLTTLSIEKNVVTFPRHLFCNLTALETLNVDNNKLSSDDAFGLGECSNGSQPTSSCGSKIEFLYASNNMMTSVKKNGFLCNLNSLIELNLANNAIGKIDREAFAHVPRLEQLNLARNLIKELPGDTFQFATQLDHLDLSNNQLSQLPVDIFQPMKRLNYLTLTGNLLHKVRVNLLGITTSRLHLNGNRLEAIDADTMDGLGSVKYLHFRYNTIKTISANAFDKCPNLKKLDLSYNKLKVFPKFRVINKLVREFRFDHNEIEELNTSDSNFTKGIKFLSLTYNRIRSIGPKALTPFKGLRELDLSNNHIENVDNLAFDGLFGLEKLNLRTNKISFQNLVLSFDGEVTQMMAITGLVNLKSLDLSHNNIQEILYPHFSSNITELLLNGNDIKKIDSNAFKNLTHLAILNLRNNSLTTLPKLQLSYPFTKIMLEDNPLLCDCSLDWLMSWQLEISSVFDLQLMRCNVVVKPANLKFLLITYIQEVKDNFVCDTFENKTKQSLLSKCLSLECKQELLCPDNCICYHNLHWTMVKMTCSNSSNFVDIPRNIPMSTDVAVFYDVAITLIDIDAFQSYKNVKHLIIRKTKLKNIHENGFKYLHILETIDLSNNELTAVEQPIFKDLFQLKRIDLSYNKLESIGLNVFDDQNSLESLNLENNRLVNFPVWSVGNLANVSSMALGGNPWSCDCTFVISFNKFLVSHAPSIANKSQLYCKHSASSDEIVLLNMFNRTQCIQTNAKA